MMDNRATCTVLLYAVDPDALSLFLSAISSRSNTVKEDDGCLGGSCVSKVIWESALLPTVEVEVLPDGKSPTLLGVLLPEVEEAGIVEKRFIGGDIDGNTEGKIMTKKNTGQNEVPVKTKKKREKLDSRTSRIMGWPLKSPSQNPRI
jgi:hypothetical protein